MANITVQGTIKQIFNSEVFGNFEKRVFWVEENGDKYPNTYQLEMQQGECPRLDGFRPGDQVECSVDVRGRFYQKNGKEGVINTLKCWKLVKAGEGQHYQKPSAPKQEPYYADTVTEPLDDLPF